MNHYDLIPDVLDTTKLNKDERSALIAAIQAVEWAEKGYIRPECATQMILACRRIMVNESQSIKKF